MRRTLISCLFLVSGCLSDQLGQQPGGNGGGSGAGNGMGGGGGAVMDPGCGKQTFPIALNQTPPVVMLVVDDSGSMKELVPGTTTAKWDVLKEAVNQLLTKYDGKVDWGLSIFPKPGTGGSSCTAGAVEIPAGAGNTQNILSRLAPLTVANIGGNTPTETTLLEVEKNGGLKQPGRNNYVLLMTDGLPTCNQDGRVTSVVSSLAKAAIRTFVVGLGDGTQSDPTQLNDWATAGKTARMTSPKYYQSNNIMELQASFEQILVGIASCTYQLTSKPQDANLIVPYLDGTAVSADPANGFVYDAMSNSLTFKGASCDKVKAGGATKVEIIYGCPSPPII